MNKDQFYFTSSESANAPSYFEFFTQKGKQRDEVIMPAEPEPDVLDIAFYDTYEVVEQFEAALQQ